MTLNLRPYQKQAIEYLYSYWAKEDGNALLVLPTGSGKSLVMAALIERLLQEFPDIRILVVTHVRELISQSFEELVKLNPWVPAGIYSAGLGRRDRNAQVLFAGVQSIAKKAHQIGHVDLILIDEAHLISRNSESNYGRLIKATRDLNPDLKLVGLTATPYRLDSGRLDDGDERLFDKVAFEISIRQLIDGGYLCRLVSKATTTMLDVSGVHKRGGEYIAGELEAAVNTDEAVHDAVAEIVAFGATRKCWLVFCAGVKHSFAVRDEIRRHGISCETVTGETPNGERDRIIRDYKAGKIRCLTGANIFTVGFNVPQVDLLAVLRETMSTGLYVQMYGRGARNAVGKENCLVLDFTANRVLHGPLDDLRIRTPGSGDGDAPIKICVCGTILAVSTRVCPDCGFEFPPNEEPKHDRTASDAPIMSQAAPEWVAVTKRVLRRHEKLGGTPTVRVDYLCGLTSHRAWICPEHSGYARKKFEDWWKDHEGFVPCPQTVDEAVRRQGELVATARIRVKPAGKYWEIVGVLPVFAREAAE